MSDDIFMQDDDSLALVGDVFMSGDEEDIDIPNPEEAAAQELSEVLAGFKARAQRENERFQDAVDSEYWFAVCFQTREQKEEFLTKLRWSLALDGDKYIDGMELARHLGVNLTSRIPAMPVAKIDKKLAELI